MDLDKSDMETISAYIKAENPGYKGPVFIDLIRLTELHMPFAELVAQMAIMTVLDNFSGWDWDAWNARQQPVKPKRGGGF